MGRHPACCKQLQRPAPRVSAFGRLGSRESLSDALMETRFVIHAAGQ